VKKPRFVEPQVVDTVHKDDATPANDGRPKPSSPGISQGDEFLLNVCAWFRVRQRKEEILRSVDA
jgi:hypothetical protein